mgnify:CR=1 FL=1
MEHKYLIVDRQEAMSCCLKYFLDQLTHTREVVSATTMKMAYEVAFVNISVPSPFVIAFMDLQLPQYVERNLCNGEDLALLFRSKHPKTKIVFVLSEYTNEDLFRINKKIKPEGIIDRDDIKEESLLGHIELIVSGGRYKSPTIENKLKGYSSYIPLFKSIDLQIIRLIEQGITTKNIPNHLSITLSTVHKRKQRIKHILDIDHGNDEDILRVCREKGIL